MDAFINKEIEGIRLKLDLIIKQNCDIKNRLEKISTTLQQPTGSENYNKAVEEFLNDFINRDI